MLFFPQLRSGAVAQLPVQRSETYRTLVNSMADGRTLRMADNADANVRWQLQYAGLSADEAQKLRVLFESAEGRLNKFTFVDPLANLLLWSEDLTRPVWTAGPQLAITQVADAFGGSAGARISNRSAAAQSVSQTMEAVGSLVYCFSAYLRADQACEVELQAGERTVANALATTAWKRWAGAGSGVGDQVTFAIVVPAGATVDVSGIQVEAQPAAGAYKATSDLGGVFSETRFDQDVLEITATDAGLFGCSVRLVSRL